MKIIMIWQNAVYLNYRVNLKKCIRKWFCLGSAEMWIWVEVDWFGGQDKSILTGYSVPHKKDFVDYRAKRIIFLCVCGECLFWNMKIIELDSRFITQLGGTDEHEDESSLMVIDLHVHRTNGEYRSTLVRYCTIATPSTPPIFVKMYYTLIANFRKKEKENRHLSFFTPTLFSAKNLTKHLVCTGKREKTK